MFLCDFTTKRILLSLPAQGGQESPLQLAGMATSYGKVHHVLGSGKASDPGQLPHDASSWKPSWTSSSFDPEAPGAPLLPSLTVLSLLYLLPRWTLATTSASSFSLFLGSFCSERGLGWGGSGPAPQCCSDIYPAQASQWPPPLAKRSKLKLLQ